MDADRLTHAIQTRRTLQRLADPYFTTKLAMERFEEAADPTIQALRYVMNGRAVNPSDPDDPYRLLDADDLLEKVDAYPVLYVLLNAPQLLSTWMYTVSGVLRTKSMTTAELRDVIGRLFTVEYNGALDRLAQLDPDDRARLLRHLNVTGIDLDDLLEEGPSALRKAIRPD
jgi:hypothetical protein